MKSQGGSIRIDVLVGLLLGVGRYPVNPSIWTASRQPPIGVLYLLATSDMKLFCLGVHYLLEKSALAAIEDFAVHLCENP